MKAEDFLSRATNVLKDPEQFKLKARPIDVSDLTLHRPCACGKKNLELNEEEVFSTWLTNKLFEAKIIKSPKVSDRLCRACRSGDISVFYRVVCLGCLEVVGRFSPWKDSKTGFEYKPGGVYHIRTCGKCATETQTVMPVEFEIHYKKLGKKL